ncbi:MAG TPA: CNP1-like family protein [Pararobbsia sp.]|nr:CNP1-like family protein [Pararobbsia sp.]
MNFSRLPHRAVRASLLAALACVAAAPAIVSAGPNDGTTPGMNGPASGEQSTFQYLFDRKSVFVEDKDVPTPPLPDYNALLPFEVSKNTTLTFAIDPKSVSIGKDDVIRYTVVITSPAGARNVHYEGIRCGDGQQWKLYDVIDEDGTAWDTDTSTGWAKIEYNSINAYQNTLAQDYFCNFSTVAGNAKTIVENIRFKRTLTDQRER